MARIRAILRRSHWSEQQQNNDNGSPTLEVDALVLNPGRQEASFDGQTLELTGTEFTLLYLLAQHLGQVVSREHLSQEVLGKRLTPLRHLLADAGAGVDVGFDVTQARFTPDDRASG